MSGWAQVAAYFVAVIVIILIVAWIEGPAPTDKDQK